MELFEVGEIDEEMIVCVYRNYETLSIRVLAAKTKRTNEDVCQDRKTQTGMQKRTVD